MIFWRKTSPICSHNHLSVADPSVNWPWCWTGLPAQMNKHDDITHSAEVSQKSVNTEDVRVYCFILKVILFYWHGFDDTFDTAFPLYLLYLVHPANPFCLCIKMKNVALQWQSWILILVLLLIRPRPHLKKSDLPMNGPILSSKNLIWVIHGQKGWFWASCVGSVNVPSCPNPPYRYLVLLNFIFSVLKSEPSKPSTANRHG